METKKISEINVEIQAMLTDGERIKGFYRFVAQNTHLSLRACCQIIVNRPDASVCYSFDEWRGMDRRILPRVARHRETDHGHRGKRKIPGDRRVYRRRRAPGRTRTRRKIDHAYLRGNRVESGEWRVPTPNSYS